MKTFKGLVVCLAVLGFCLPQPLLAAQTGRGPVIYDVKLHKGAMGPVMIGQVQDQQGKARVNVPVVLYSQGRKLAEGRTDGNGRFHFRNLRGGLYQLESGGGVGAYRVWSPGTAPPSAQPAALILADQDLVRGQGGLGGLGFWLSHPLVIAGGVAAAVAIPVALHNAKDEPASP